MTLVNHLRHYDLRLFYRLNKAGYSRWVTGSRIISHTGDGYWYPLIAIMLYSTQQWSLLSVFSVAFTIERMSYFLLKNSFKRPRPAQALEGYKSHIRPSDQFSFPSGHTSAAFVTAWTLAHAFPTLFVVVYIWAIGVGISRVVLGVHYPTDIIAGSLHGQLIIIITSAFIMD